MEQIIQAVKLFTAQNIDYVVFAMVICGGLFAKKYMKDVNLPVAVKTLVIGTLFTVLYVVALFVSGQWSKIMLPKYLTSYAIATSFYEIALKYIFDAIKARFGNDIK